MAKAKETKAKKPKVDKKTEHAPNDYAAKIMTRIVQTWKGNAPDSWRSLSEVQQHSVIGLISETVREQVQAIITEQAAKSWPFVPVEIKGVNFVAKGAKISLIVADLNEGLKEAAQHVEGNAVLILADPDIYLGGKMPKPEKDQQDLPLNEDEDESGEGDDDA